MKTLPEAEELQAIAQLVAKAQHYAATDPEVGLAQARKAAEAIARCVFSREIGEPGKIMLDAMLQKLTQSKVIPPSIGIPFGTLQAYGNFGVHAQSDTRAIDRDYVQPAVAALEQVYAWLRSEYLKVEETLPAASGPAPAASPPASRSRSTRALGAAAVGALLGLGVVAAVLGSRSAAPAVTGEDAHREKPASEPPVAKAEAKPPGSAEMAAAPNTPEEPAPPRALESTRASGQGLTLDFSVLAQRPGEKDFVTLRGGESVWEGTRVAFALRVSSLAHVYLAERHAATGELEVLFPNPGIPVANPLPADTWVRIPPSVAFRVDDKDLGTETLFLVASQRPVQSLAEALAGVDGKQPGAMKRAEAELLALASAKRPAGCPPGRGLVLDGSGGDCDVQGRGLDLEPQVGAPPPSARRQATAQDPVLFVPFRFQHVPKPVR
ncbi:MAG: DUF4384 domain-containing protein [Myxococcales bacterium]